MKQISEALERRSGALFSPCRTWRYALWRNWGLSANTNMMMAIGLNPSKADETMNDPTIRRDIGFAKAWGFDGLFKLNLYSFCATEPLDMVQADDPVGPGNDEAFMYFRSRVGLFVAGWGSLAMRYRSRVHWQSRIERVLSLIQQPIYCLGKTKDGSPRHPLYVKADKERELFWKPSC